MRDLVTIKRAILHCSATPDYVLPDKRFDMFGASDIRTWHKQRGFNDIGYHFVIRRTGVLEEGRPLEEIGAHTSGENHNSVGVCYIGTCRPTLSQVKTLVNLSAYLRGRIGITWSDWFGHYEFTAHKTCPGIPMDLFRDLLMYASK